MKIKLPTGTITTGPGTVPTSKFGAPYTSMKKLIPALKAISELGLFDKSDERYQEYR